MANPNDKIFEADILLACKPLIWFTDHPTIILKLGQVLLVKDEGRYKQGNGTTQLSALPFFGATSSWGALTGSPTDSTSLVSYLTGNYEQLINKGIANGYASLDATGKLPISQLPISAMEYKGQWNATTNIPVLINGTGNTGDVYAVSVAGTQNFGAGAITFIVGDQVIYNGTIWEKGPSGVNAPLGQVVYGTGVGSTSSSNFVYTESASTASIMFKYPVTPTNTIEVRSDNNGAFVQGSHVGGIYFDSLLSSGTFLRALHASGPLRFYTGGNAAGNERINISSTGIVKIGIAAQTSVFDRNLILSTSGLSNAGIGMFDATASDINISMGQSNANFGIINKFNSATGSNWTGTSIPIASNFSFINNPNPVFIGGTPIYAAAGTTSTNYGYRLDAVGFRIGQLSTLNTANATYSFEVTSGQARIGSSTPTIVVAATKLYLSEDGAVQTMQAITNANTGGQESIWLSQDSSTNISVWRHYNTAVGGSYTGTSLTLAGTTTLFTGGNNDKSLILGGTPIIALPGVTGTNYGYRLDTVGFRIDQLSTLHNTNSFPFSVNGIAQVGSGTSLETTSQLQITGTGNQQLGITSLTASAYSVIRIGQSAASYSGWFFYGSTAAGNYSGTSIPVLSTSQYGSGSTLNLPFITAGTPVYALVGTTSTNYGTRLDATGLRVGIMSGLHTGNTVSFEVTTTGVFQISSTGTTTVTAAGVPWTVNSSNSNANKIGLQDNGTARGFFGASSTEALFISNNTGVTTLFSVLNAGGFTSGNLSYSAVTNTLTLINGTGTYVLDATRASATQAVFRVGNSNGSFVFGFDTIGGYAQALTASKGMYWYNAAGTTFMGIKGAGGAELVGVLGNLVWNMSCPATNDDPTISLYQNRTTTTDATLTTLHTLATANDTNVTIIGTVISRRTGGAAGTTGDVASYTFTYVFKNVAGTLTSIGGAVTVVGESQAAWDCQVNISAANLLIQVQGAVNNNVTWHLAELKVSTVST